MTAFHFSSSVELNQYVAGQSDPATCLLSFSAGKDSIAAWLELRRYFARIVPVYLYLIPDLEFVNRSLDYYEDWFETRIIRLPHPSLYRWLNSLMFQAPENIRTIDRAGLPDFDYDDSFAVAMHDAGMPKNTYTAIGVRAVDSLNRWASIKQHGAVNAARRTFFPIYDWRKDRLIDEISRSGVKLPEEYRYFGRSFDGLDYRFLAPIKEHYPDDYARILDWFPLADLELARQHYRQEYHDGTA